MKDREPQIGTSSRTSRMRAFADKQKLRADSSRLKPVRNDKPKKVGNALTSNQIFHFVFPNHHDTKLFRFVQL
jgi:hypothetical protein